jgi:UDP-N-acetylmuramoyl-tripeptide--D-alanyl-D-alanine ligase
MLLKLNKGHEYAVLEMGANHPKEIDYLVSLTNPHIAIINNAGPAHLEGFESLDGVAKAKGEILQGDIPPAYAILNYDDRYFGLWREMAVRSDIISFGLDSKATIYAKDVELRNNYSSFKLMFPENAINIKLPILGKHNIMNAIAAAAILYALKKPISLIKNGLESVRTIPGRLQLMNGLYNHCVINDTYNANPTSTIAAIGILGKMDKTNCLVFGDMKELGEKSRLMHESIGRAAKDADIDIVVATGEMTKYTVSKFGPQGYWFKTIEELLDYLHELIRLTPDMNILVKGSRSMQMERVINEITKQ